MRLPYVILVIQFQVFKEILEELKELIEEENNTASVSAKSAKSVEDPDPDSEWLQGTNINITATKVGLSEILKWISYLIPTVFHSDTFASFVYILFIILF